MPISWIEIDLAALRHNLQQVESRMSPGTRILGVVKSDAYGHGMIPTARELTAAGVPFLAVSKLWEAQEIRAHNIQTPILILLGLEGDDVEAYIQEDLRPILYRMDHAKLLSRAAVRHDKPAKFHLKVDTGMGRLGVPYNEVATFLEELFALPGLELEGVLSHFAVADESDKSFSEQQIERFRQVLKKIAQSGRDVPFAHISNSAGILDLPHAHFQLVRPGIMLYGSPPSQELHRPADLRPVMTFKAKIIQIKEALPGQSIGYGRTFVVKKPSRIATIPVGYDDGYSRLLSNRGQVLIRGRRAPVVGRVSMNMITVDVTHLPQAREDDEVVLLGSQGNETITAEELAGLCGTISYEIYCSLGKHRFRYFLNATEH